MLLRYKLSFLPVLIISVVLSSSLQAGEKDPIEGTEYENFVSLQYNDFQEALESVIDESEGFLVTGPIDTRISGGKAVDYLYHSIRIICPDIPSLQRALELIGNSDRLKLLQGEIYLDSALATEPVGFRGIAAQIEWQGEKYRVQLVTTQQTRWLLWLRWFYLNGNDEELFDLMNDYIRAVSDYFYAVDNGQIDAEPPKAADFGLPESTDIYAPAPDYVIQGYQNYLDYLYAHREINTDFAHGINAFVPTDSLLLAWIERAPEAAFPNKEAPMLQHEYRKFTDRLGDVRVMQTLTGEGFDTLMTGEYFFAVSLAGEIRFGRELLRAEVERLEKETGRKVPRANHAFLFPGEPLLTAGAFFIERTDVPRLVKVTAQSGHYFYSNVSPGIREDIAVRSDYYLTTLGHFFKALRDLGIDCKEVVISKF